LTADNSRHHLRNSAGVLKEDVKDSKTWWPPRIPINVLVAKLSTFGPIPASYQFGAGGFPAHPAIGPSWKVRAVIVLLLPRKK
jgi:hypothetical protein